MTISFIVKKSKAGFVMDDMEGGATIYVRLRDGRALDSTMKFLFRPRPGVSMYFLLLRVQLNQRRNIPLT